MDENLVEGGGGVNRSKTRERRMSESHTLPPDLSGCSITIWPKEESVDHRIGKRGGGGFCARCGVPVGAWFMCHECIEELLYLERDKQDARRAEIASIARTQRFLDANRR